MAMVRSSDSLHGLARHGVFNIDPPTLPNAIMRRAKPLPRREQWNRLEQNTTELDPSPRIREQNTALSRHVGGQDRL